MTSGCMSTIWQMKRPDWAVEVLVAFLVDPTRRSGEANERGKVAVLRSREHPWRRPGPQGGRRAPPASFVTPSCRTSNRSWRPRPMSTTGRVCDRMPTSRAAIRTSSPTTSTKPLRRHDLGHPYLGEWLIRSDAAHPRATCHRPDEGAQWLLYQGLRAGGAAYAEWAAELLLEGRHRRLSGYASNSVWTTRQVLAVISPHISDELFGRLEAQLRDLRFPGSSADHPGTPSTFVVLGRREDF